MSSKRNLPFTELTEESPEREKYLEIVVIVIVRPDPSSLSSSLSAEAPLLSIPDVDGIVEVTNKVIVVGLAVVVFDIFALCFLIFR